MTAQIYTFSKDRKKSGKPTTLVRVKTEAEIFQDTFEDVLTDWQRAAVRNKLNNYIDSKLPIFLKCPTGTDYTSDLNALSVIERKMDLKIALFWPGCTSANPIGWIAGFHRGATIYTTPSDMVSEAAARAINIVLYLTFEYHLKSLKF
jgi:hypothetical protein